MGLKAKTTVPHGQRAFNRLRLGLPASLILHHEQVPCVLKDISATGACVQLAQSITEGGTVVLCFHLLRLPAAVMWSRDTLHGLHFESRLEREDLQGFLWIVQNRAEYERICNDELLVHSSSSREDSTDPTPSS
jgi:hypothetical protein